MSKATFFTTAFAVCFATICAFAAAPEFQRVTLTDDFYAEGSALGDFNQDGQIDVAYGPFIFLGPDFQQKITVFEPKVFDPENYSQQFLLFSDDVNHDGWLDLVEAPWPGEKGYWYENPKGKDGYWPKHFISDEIGNESQIYTDVNGDGLKDLVFCKVGYIGFASYDPANPTQPWKWTPVSEKRDYYERYYHGIGAGDVNNDGFVDILESKGWWENPGKPDHTGPWKWHEFPFARRAANMAVIDIDGDGLNDVLNADDAHLFGLQWWKALKDANGELTFTRMVLIPEDPDKTPTPIRISQLHALAVGDFNGNGLPDFVTGKRFWAHGSKGDVEADKPALLLLFTLSRENGQATYTPSVVDDNSGVGTQVTVGDVNKDGKLDILSGNKKGCHLFIQK